MKIWGMRAGGMGDLMMAIPFLTYFEKKYPKSYKYWVINKKCSHISPVFINHPLIDNIHIMGNWETLTEHDMKIMNDCDIILNVSPTALNRLWYNEMDAIDQAALMAGIQDLNDVLTPDEKIPELVKWFSSPQSLMDERNNGYNDREYVIKTPTKKVGIFPFAKYCMEDRRSPSAGWWDVLCGMLLKENNIEIRHFGWYAEPDFSGTIRHTHDPYYEQVKMALECDVLIGTDTGTMWITGAYGIPTIHLMTYWAPGHNQNPTAFMPVNRNGVLMFNEKNCNLIKPKDVYQKTMEIINAK